MKKLVSNFEIIEKKKYDYLKNSEFRLNKKIKSDFGSEMIVGESFAS